MTRPRTGTTVPAKSGRFAEYHQRDPLRFELADLLFHRLDFARQLRFETIVFRDLQIKFATGLGQLLVEPVSLFLPILVRGVHGQRQGHEHDT